MEYFVSGAGILGFYGWNILFLWLEYWVSMAGILGFCDWIIVQLGPNLS